MASFTQEEIELSQKHEEILGKRGFLLQQMKMSYEERKAKKEQQLRVSQAAKERNTHILKDFENAEKKMKSRQLLHPDVIGLETRYWASVERKLPQWEAYLLRRDQPPISASRTPKQRRKNARDLDPPPADNSSKPPRPKPP